MYGKTIESALFTNFINKYQQFKLLASNSNLESILIEKKEKNTEKIMNATQKFKAIWHSFFQSNNTFLVQKSMKHVNAYDSSIDTTNDYRKKREKNNESVRKSRAKNRVKVQECAKVVAELKMENTQLNNKLNGLQSELFTLKGLFQHCFSFDLNNLAIKPSDIPTSTLFKIIMKKDPVKQTGPLNSQLKSIEPSSSSLNKTDLDEIDNFYINQIKNALTNITTKPDINKNNVEKKSSGFNSSMLVQNGYSNLISQKNTSL